jgi:hypothetical protein
LRGRAVRGGGRRADVACGAREMSRSREKSERRTRERGQNLTQDVAWDAVKQLAVKSCRSYRVDAATCLYPRDPME